MNVALVYATKHNSINVIATECLFQRQRPSNIVPWHVTESRLAV